MVRGRGEDETWTKLGDGDVRAYAVGAGSWVGVGPSGLRDSPDGLDLRKTQTDADFVDGL